MVRISTCKLYTILVFSEIEVQSVAEPRYEVKLVATGPSLPLVKSWVRTHRGGFVMSYSPRRVNNVYLDTPGFQWLQDNLAGISERRKVRFRWYGDEVSRIEGTLEVKRKLNRQSWKVTYPLNRRFDFQGQIKWADFVAALVDELPVQMKAEVENSWWPMLINRYNREYYVSPDGEVRITIDYDQELYDQRLSIYPDLTRRVPCPDTVIVEVKGALGSWDRIMEVSSGFPVSVSRNSKYAVACQAIFNY